MTRITIVAALGVLLGSLGCATTPDPPHFREATFFDLKGIVAESATCTDPPTCKAFGFSKFEKTKVNNVSVKSRMPVATQDLIMSKQIVKLSVTRGGSAFFNYIALMGPNPGSNANVIGLLEQSDPTIKLATEGWVLIAGSLPRAKSDWVSGGADGSTIVLHKVGGNLQRFFYLEGATGVTATVSCLRDPTKTRDLATPGTYINILPGCMFDPPGAGSSFDIGTAAQEVRDFVDYVKAAAEAAD